MELTSLTNSLKIHLCMELFSQNISFTLTKYFRLPKGKKLSTYLSRAKKKKERERERARERERDTERKELGGNLHPWEGVVRWKAFHTVRNPIISH